MLVAEVSLALDVVEGTVDVGSSQPNQPGVLQVDVVLMDALIEVDVGVCVKLGVGTAAAVVVMVVFTGSSLQPNQPGLRHVVVVIVVNGTEEELVLPVVVDSSRQPHQPGVLHVDVRVRVADADVLVRVVLGSVPLLS